jgi:thiamine-phosphate pyrophosphorylase
MFIRYAITDRNQYGKSGPESGAGLIAQAERLATEGVDFIQLREKDLAAKEVIGFARGMISAIRRTGSHTRLLVNGRADIALASGADGVHLPSGEEQLTPGQVRSLYAGTGVEPVISVSCHNLAEVERASKGGADLILFGPVFGKSVQGKAVVPGVGMEALQAACAAAGDTPVLALGGVTQDNASLCMEDGAGGVAAIRFFR